jgi:PIN domain nuclease of toxin-antitoxin system
VRLLLDSHTLLWFVEDDPQMPDPVKELIEDEQHDKYVSVASVWELAIKVGLGKLTLAKPIEIYLPEVVEQNGFLILPVTTPHALLVAKLPFHHKDPFDRLLIAQSLHETMPIVGIDAVFDSYGVTRYWDHLPAP